MPRKRELPAPRNWGLGSATKWFFAMLALGVIVALLVVAVVPADNGGSERGIPNTPPPVRTQ